MAKDIQIKFDDSLWKKRVRELARRAKIEEEPIIKEQASLLVASIAKYAPPYATFPAMSQKAIGRGADKKAGEKAILSDLNHVFFVPDDPKIINWARKQFKGGQIWTSGKITGAGVGLNLMDMQKHHEKFQNRQTGRLKRVNLSDRMWVKKPLFNKYYRNQIKKVGIAKAALARSAVYFNPKTRVPAWVKRHFNRSASTSTLRRGRGGPTAIFSGKAAGLQHVKSRTVSLVTASRAKAMEKRMLAIVKQSAKKAGLKAK